MTEINYYDGKIHEWSGPHQPVEDGVMIRAWTCGGQGHWEGKVYPAEMWAWDILGVSSDIKQFQVVT